MSIQHTTQEEIAREYIEYYNPCMPDMQQGLTFAEASYEAVTQREEPWHAELAE